MKAEEINVLWWLPKEGPRRCHTHGDRSSVALCGANLHQFRLFPCTWVEEVPEDRKCKRCLNLLAKKGSHD